MEGRALLTVHGEMNKGPSRPQTQKSEPEEEDKEEDGNGEEIWLSRTVCSGICAASMTLMCSSTLTSL